MSTPELEDVYQIRRQVQRAFEGAKAKNVEPYANYIVALSQGAVGITPQVVLYTSNKLNMSPLSNTTHDGAMQLDLPWDVEFVSIDGETQLAARHEAAKISPATKQMFVDVRICFDYPIDWAKQAFHDLNALSVRPNATLSLAMDMRDPLTSITRDVAGLSFFSGHVLMTGRQPKKTDATSYITLSVLRTATVCFNEGIGGVQRGNKPVSMDKARAEQVRDAAQEYFGALAEKIGPAFQDWTHTVAASPAVMAALGALGSTVSNIATKDLRAAEIDRVLHKLDGIDWMRGQHWDGICGKVRSDGVFSTAGGAKDSGYATFNALTDLTGSNYQRIRHIAASNGGEPTAPMAEPIHQAEPALTAEPVEVS